MGPGKALFLLLIARVAFAAEPGFSPEAPGCAGSALHTTCISAQTQALESFRLAVNFHNRGELTLAANQYRKTIQLDPTLVSAVINLAIIHEKWREPAQAENLYNDAVRIAPRSFAARYNRGQFLQKLGRLAAAREDYAVALQIKPDEASLFVNMAGIEIRLFEEKRDIALLVSAEKNLNRASSLKSKSPALYFNRARLMEFMNFPARARIFYEEAMRYYAPRSAEYKTCVLRAERISRQLR